jgi:hypothetical protein
VKVFIQPVRPLVTNYHVICPFSKSLSEWILFSVAHFEHHAFTPWRKDVCSILKETGRNVGKGVAVKVVPNFIEDILGRATGSSTNFQYVKVRRAVCDLLCCVTEP